MGGEGRFQPAGFRASFLHSLYSLHRKVAVNALRAMKSCRSAALLPLLALACGSATAPVPPGPQVSGRLELVASLTDLTEIETGQRTVTDAAGVPVQLVRNDTVVATAYSVRGQFRFFGVAAGDYTIRLPEPGLAAFTLPVTVASSSVNLVLPLRIEPASSTLTAPNPCTRMDGLAIYRAVAPAGPVRAEVLTLGFESVWSFGFANHPAALFHVHWLPELGNPPGMYWVRVRTGGSDTLDLVFLSP